MNVDRQQGGLLSQGRDSAFHHLSHLVCYMQGTGTKVPFSLELSHVWRIASNGGGGANICLNFVCIAMRCIEKYLHNRLPGVSS